MRIIVLIIILLLTGCEENLIRTKSEIEANRILSGLRNSGIEAKKVVDLDEWLIKVKEKQFTEALDVLERKRLYNRLVGNESKDAQTKDIFSSKAEKSNEIVSKVSRELSDSIVMLPGVIDARVHIYKNLNEGFLPETIKSSASVIIITNAANAIDHQEIKMIISKGSGINPESVFVIEEVEIGETNKKIGKVENEQSLEIALNKINLKNMTRHNMLALIPLIISFVWISFSLIKKKLKINSERKILSKIVNQVK